MSPKVRGEAHDWWVHVSLRGSPVWDGIGLADASLEPRALDALNLSKPVPWAATPV